MSINELLGRFLALLAGMSYGSMLHYVWWHDINIGIALSIPAITASVGIILSAYEDK